MWWRRKTRKEEYTAKWRRSEEVWIPMASTLSSVLSRLDGCWELPRWLPACLLAGPGVARPASWLADCSAGCFDSRLLEKPDSFCAKLCFPSRVYVLTHGRGTQCWLFRCVCVRACVRAAVTARVSPLHYYSVLSSVALDSCVTRDVPK